MTGASRHTTFSAFAHRDYRLFWVGLLASNVGTFMQIFGLGYLVVQLAVREGRPELAPAYVGIVGLVRAVPGLGLGLLGGAVADRVDRRRMMILTQVAAACNAAALAALTLFDLVTLPVILMLAALDAATFAFAGPTRHSIVPRLVDPERIASAVGLQSVAWDVAAVAGPLLGGLLFPVTGLVGLFGINSMSYLVYAVALAFIAPIPHTGGAAVGVWRSISDGLHYMRDDAVIRWLLAISIVTALLARPYVQLLPAFAEVTLNVGAIELSWLFAASAAGSLVASLVTAALGPFSRKAVLAVVSAGVLGLLLAIFSVQRGLTGALLLAAALGFASLLSMGLANTVLNTRTPDRLRGRVMGVQSMVYVGFAPLGAAFVGLAGAAVGMETALFAGGLVAAVLAFYAALRVSALRTTGADSEHEATPAPAGVSSGYR